MRRAGHILADVDGPAARAGEAGHVHAGDRRGRGGFIRDREGAKPAFKGYRGFPATVVHLDQRGSGARDPRRRSAGSGRATSSASTSGASWKGTTPTARSPCRSARCRRGCSSCSTSPGRAWTGHRAVPARAVGWATSRTPIQQHVESHGFGVVRAFVGHGIGRALHEEPQVPNFGDAGRGPAAQGGHGAGHRAHGDDGALGGARAGRTAGRR